MLLSINAIMKLVDEKCLTDALKNPYTFKAEWTPLLREISPIHGVLINIINPKKNKVL